MNAIDRVKELLAAAEKPHIGECRRKSWLCVCGRSEAVFALRELARPFAEALVESQAALLNIDLSDEATLDAADAGEQVIVRRAAAVWREARAALRLEKLEKAMENPPVS